MNSSKQKTATRRRRRPFSFGGWGRNVRPSRVRLFFIITALLIAAASLLYSHLLTRQLYAEEVGKMEVWAEAMRSLNAPDGGSDLGLVLKVINSNNTIPVVVTDAHGDVLAHRNLSPTPCGTDSIQQLTDAARRLRREGERMAMDLGAGGHGAHEYIYIYYTESVLLRQLTVYPYVQLFVVGLFFALAVVALLAAKRAEQNRVWVGLSRETAHQLGTPISSLMAWSQVLREVYPDDELLPEMEKDVTRLQLIADRFSKIGSAPELSPQSLTALVRRVAEYYDRRTSAHVVFHLELPADECPVEVNAQLFEWVIENLCKNAVDAMEGRGEITLRLRPLPPPHRTRRYQIQVSDTGKGIERGRFTTVFRPGFTTKKRGWGLGLSLAKRIVEEYHHGRIYVLDSHIGQGTTFAVEV